MGWSPQCHKRRVFADFAAAVVDECLQNGRCFLSLVGYELLSRVFVCVAVFIWLVYVYTSLAVVSQGAGWGGEAQGGEGRGGARTGSGLPAGCFSNNVLNRMPRLCRYTAVHTSHMLTILLLRRSGLFIACLGSHSGGALARG